MDQRTYIINRSIWLAVILAIISAVCNILNFKVIEETLFLEIAKRVLVSIGVIVPWVGLMAYTLIPLCFHHVYEKRKKK